MGCSTQSVVKEPYLITNKTIETKSSVKSEEILKKKESILEIKISQNKLIGTGQRFWKSKYNLLEKIGSGTYGTVYKVLHIELNQLRAMKSIRKSSILSQDDDQSFLKEIEVLSSLDHPHILKILEYFEDDTKYYIVTELCEGTELYEKIIELQQFTEHDAAKIMKMLFSCIFYIHSKGVVHRDLKPENILINNDLSNIKLIDFGTSRYFDRSLKLTCKIGTAYYIAPEVIGECYDYKCDIWSLGVILYVLLSGTPPFQGDDDNGIMKSVKSGHFSFDGEEWLGISTEAKDLIKKLLEFNPKKRIDAEQAYKDPWIIKYASLEKPSIDISKISIENIRKFGNRMKFQQATIAFLVHQQSNTGMMKELRDIFEKFDINGDGQLTYDELKAGFNQYFQDEQIADNEFNELIKKIDLDNNNYIEYEEFLRVAVDLNLLLTDKNLKVAFDFFDKDHSGTLTQEEIKEVLVMDSDNTKKTDDFISKIIKEIDTNGDGEISYDEFKQLMAKISK